MELHAVDIAAPVLEAHDGAVFRLGGDLETVRQTVAIDDQRMVTGRCKRRRNVCEYSFSLMADRRKLAVHENRGAHHIASKSLADRLMAEAYAKDRDVPR